MLNNHRPHSYFFFSSLDLVISCLGLHWTNDLPGAMIQVYASMPTDSCMYFPALDKEVWVDTSFALSFAKCNFS